MNYEQIPTYENPKKRLAKKVGFIVICSFVIVNGFLANGCNETFKPSELPGASLPDAEDYDDWVDDNNSEKASAEEIIIDSIANNNAARQEALESFSSAENVESYIEALEDVGIKVIKINKGVSIYKQIMDGDAVIKVNGKVISIDKIGRVVDGFGYIREGDGSTDYRGVNDIEAVIPSGAGGTDN